VKRSDQTRRQTLAHVSVCLGCCCGQVEKGHPEVPVAWLKEQWKTRRLLKHVHLSISGCLGPCDRSNVVSIASPAGVTWLGGLERRDQFMGLVDWATDVAAAQRVLPIPPPLSPQVFDRYREASSPARVEEFR